MVFLINSSAKIPPLRQYPNRCTQFKLSVMKLLIVIGILVSQQCLSQSIIRTILDSNNQKPIPYATIKVLNSTRGDIANVRGEFQIDINLNDTVMISSVGYLSKIVVGKEIGSAIFLIPKVHVLETVTVRNKMMNRTIVIGNGKDLIEQKINCRFTDEGPKDGCWPWGPSDSKEEFAEKLTLDSTKLYKFTRVYVPTRKRDEFGPLLLRIYSVDNLTGLPKEELFIKNVEVTRKSIYKSKVLIDLSADNFYSSGQKHIFISVGWPSGQNAKSNFTSLTLLELDQQNTYSRSLVSKTFEWFPFGHVSNKTQNKKPINTVFAVVLEEYKQ